MVKAGSQAKTKIKLMTHEFKHPKYYKELRDAGNELAKRNAVKEDLTCSGSSPARNKSDQAISKRQPTGESERASWSGPQASSSKPQATQTQKETSCSSDKNQHPQASSDKLQAPSRKHQAPSRKRQAP